MKFQRPVYYTGNWMPFFQRRPLLLRLYALAFLIFSPLLIPSLVLYIHWGEVTEGLKDAYDALVGRHIGGAG